MPTTGCSSVGGARNLVPQFPRLYETRIEVLSPRGCPEHSMAAGRMCDQRAGLRHHREQLWRVCGPPRMVLRAMGKEPSGTSGRQGGTSRGGSGFLTGL